MSGTRYTAFQSRDVTDPPWLVYSLDDTSGYGFEICRCKKRSNAVKIRAALNFMEVAKRKKTVRANRSVSKE